MDLRVVVIGPVGAIDTGEDRLQAVVVRLLDRIELVIVAAGAVDRQADERRHGRHHHVVAIEKRAMCLSTVPSRSSAWPTKSHGPAAMKPVATMPCGLSGNSTSPASCSSTKRA